MPLRPIDAIFVHPEWRLYVVYYRGALWQLPRMKVDDAAWQRRQPYNGDTNALYVSRRQVIHDPVLAQKLRTLDLPAAVYGSTLPLFEAWWEVHGFYWLKEKIISGQSPLAAHRLTALRSALNTTANNSGAIQPKDLKNTDIFADMLADLVDEVMHHRI